MWAETTVWEPSLRHRLCAETTVWVSSEWSETTVSVYKMQNIMRQVIRNDRMGHSGVTLRSLWGCPPSLLSANAGFMVSQSQNEIDFRVGTKAGQVPVARKML